MSDSIVIAHFDGHGVASGAVLARRLGARIISRYPDTGPRRLADLLDELDADMRDVYILDIPVDLMDPDRFIGSLERLASRASTVTYMDHHNSTRRFLKRLAGAGVVTSFWHNTVGMALYLAGGDRELLRLAFVGVVSDRDSFILRHVERDEVEGYYMKLANTLDVLVRKDTQGTAERLAEEGIGYLESMAGRVDYPPERLAERVDVTTWSGSVGLASFVDGARDVELSRWLPKTLEEVMRRRGLEYMVVPASYRDNRTGETVYSVGVVQYWLSSLPVAGRILASSGLAGGRRVIGHGMYQILTASDREDAEELAREVFHLIVSSVRGPARAGRAGLARRSLKAS